MSPESRSGAVSDSAQPPLIGPAADEKLHVMSFNLRYDCDTTPHSWPERRARVKHLLQRERPTVLGTQEGLFHQVRQIRADLDGYDWVHLSRLGGSASESMAVFFDTQRLEVTDYGHLWLSDTPLLIGSATWGTPIPRMLTWVRFTDVVPQKDFVLLNTHFDHKSVEAREKSAELVRATVEDFDVPVLATGDFNTTPGTAPYETLVGDGLLEDTWESAEQRLTPAYETYNAWDPTPAEGARIDWILASPGTAVTTAGINTWAPGGLSPSDHWPVQALVSIT